MGYQGGGSSWVTERREEVGGAKEGEIRQEREEGFNGLTEGVERGRLSSGYTSTLVAVSGPSAASSPAMESGLPGMISLRVSP